MKIEQDTQSFFAKDRSYEPCDETVLSLIQEEEVRQSTTINLIASENYTHPIIQKITGSALTNKYAEGYPGKRYYSGCAIIDQIELLAQKRCNALFNAEHSNVQPHAGSQANMAVFLGLLQPGNTIMGMNLRDGGHLTHGHAVNFSGTYYKSIQYTVNPETELLDYAAIEKLAHQCKPQLIIAGASAYSRIIDYERFAAIAKEVDAFFLADIAHIAGLIATQLHPNPLPFADVVTSTTHKTLRGPRGGFILSKQQYAQDIDKAIMPGMQGGPFLHAIAAKATAFHLAASDSFHNYQEQVISNAQIMAQEFKNYNYRIVSDGTDNHLFIVDLRSKHITGKHAEHTLEKVGITVSRSCIPFDPERPWITSGIRIGTPAISTRGMKEAEVKNIVYFIHEALMHYDNDHKLSTIRHAVKKLCQQFPIY